MPENTFRPHFLKWTDAKVKIFWDYYVRNPSLQSTSFALEVGEDIVRRTRGYHKREGKNLDYGCGFGALLQYLFAAGVPCAGLDSSEESVSALRERFEGNALFQGALVSSSLPNRQIPDGAYDFVYFVETIEHILPENLPAQLKELSRIVKPGGYLFVSTPNDEDLSKQQIICPDCGAIYHRVQHQSSFTVQSMNELMQKAGFETVWCEATLLVRPSAFERIKKVLRLVTRSRSAPHLIYLGKRI